MSASSALAALALCHPRTGSGISSLVRRPAWLRDQPAHEARPQVTHVGAKLGANQAASWDHENRYRRRPSLARLWVLLLLSLALTKVAVPAEVTDGVWLMRSVAVQIFGCNGLHGYRA